MTATLLTRMIITKTKNKSCVIYDIPEYVYCVVESLYRVFHLWMYILNWVKMEENENIELKKSFYIHGKFVNSCQKSP